MRKILLVIYRLAIILFGVAFLCGGIYFASNVVNALNNGVVLAVPRKVGLDSFEVYFELNPYRFIFVTALYGVFSYFGFRFAYDFWKGFKDSKEGLN